MFLQGDGSLSRGVSVEGVSVEGSLCLGRGGLYPGEGISVQGRGSLCMGSLEISVQEGLYQGVPVQGVSI